MERCSYFIQDKALFGSFPTQEIVHFLEDSGVRYFIDLTYSNEHNTRPYTTKYNYINYPIIDRKIPENWKTFAQLIIKTCNIINNLNNGEKIYVHCKGGHGRSGIFVASIFCYYYGISPEEALRQTSRCHSNRPEMREKWRIIGSPQGKKQKDFIYKFFRLLKFTKPETYGYNMGLHNLSKHCVTIPGIGTFPNSQLAFQYYKDPNNKEYVENLLQGIYRQDLLNGNVRIWEENKVDYMYKILEYKFNQHDNIRMNLINTGLRPIVKVSHDSFWGNGYGHGKNIYGKLLNKLRNNYLLQE